MLSRFHLIPERYGQTDRQTDGRTDKIAISISRVSVLTRDKNTRMKAYDMIVQELIWNSLELQAVQKYQKYCRKVLPGCNNVTDDRQTSDE